MSLIHNSRDSNEYYRFGYVTKVKKSTILGEKYYIHKNISLTSDGKSMYKYIAHN
ncbi:MAG: hypothetical protein LBB45_01820 [Methanobrevibacter sp.]|jgi:hypothetical protein|nr:hypothetical protein [Candidatus Methanovirga basalitermitum]